MGENEFMQEIEPFVVKINITIEREASLPRLKDFLESLADELWRLSEEME